MPERPIIAAAAFGPIQDMGADLRSELRGGLSSIVSRRLSPAALALHATIPPDAIAPADDIIFASSLGASKSLENYLKSFPNPSPANFQNSVHAAVLETVLVLRHASVRRLQSFANSPDSLAPAAFRSALLSDAPTTHLIFAEEFAPWLSTESIGANHTLACWIQLGPKPADGEQEAPHSIGTLRWANSADSHQNCTLPTLIKSVREHSPLHFGGPAFGGFEIQWQ